MNNFAILTGNRERHGNLGYHRTRILNEMWLYTQESFLIGRKTPCDLGESPFNNVRFLACKQRLFIIHTQGILHFPAKSITCSDMFYSSKVLLFSNLIIHVITDHKRKEPGKFQYVDLVLEKVYRFYIPIREPGLGNSLVPMETENKRTKIQRN